QRVARQIAEAIERCEIFGKRIALGLMAEDADDRRDALQDLVARDQDMAVIGIEGCVLVRVAARHDHLEGAPAEYVALAVTQALVLLRHRVLAARDRRFLIGKAPHRLLAAAMPHQKGVDARTKGAPVRRAAPKSEEPFAMRRLEAAAETIDQPA